MGLPEGFHKVYFLGLLFLSCGLLLQLIALASVQWSVTPGTPTLYYGLWDTCQDNECTEYHQSLQTASLGACQAFSILGMVVGGATLIMCLVYAYMGVVLKKSPQKIVPLVAMISSAVSFILILVCVVTWAGGMPMRQEAQFGYSFALSIVGGLVITTGGILIYFGSG